MSLRPLVRITLVAGLIQLIFVPSAWAASCGGQETSYLSCGSVDAIWTIILTIITVLTAGVGILAVGGIAYGAFLYTTSGDNSAQTSKAREIIRNVIIGLVAFAAMYAFLQFIIPGGVFNRNLAVIRSDDPDFASDIPDETGGSGGGSGGGLSSGSGTAEGTGEAAFNFATYNVLGFDHDTSASRYGNDERMKRAAELLSAQSVDVAVLNEINVGAQRSTILANLSGWSGTGLSTGNQDVIVIWNSDVFSLENSGTYNIPVIPGRPERPQPWVKLRHKDSKRVVFVYGLHLSLDNATQREGATQALAHMKARNASESAVFIVAGDMNSNDGADKVTYTVLKNSGLLSYSRETAAKKVGDNCDTHHSLGSQDCRTTRGSHIDQVWYSDDQKVSAKSYSVIANDETAHISDHNPLIVSFKIPAPKK